MSLHPIERDLRRLIVVMLFTMCADTTMAQQNKEVQGLVPEPGANALSGTSEGVKRSLSISEMQGRVKSRDIARHFPDAKNAFATSVRKKTDAVVQNMKWFEKAKLGQVDPY